MGYRSTIMFGVEQSHAPKLDEILKKHEMTADEKKLIVYPNYEMVKDEFGDFESWKRAGNVKMVIYKFEYMKWYDDYPEVMAITKYLNDLHEEVVGAEETTFLVGLGEEGEIHSAIGDWYNYVDHISKLEISE